MFIAIATDDFNIFRDNNTVEEYGLFTNRTEHPIFTGMTIEETRNHLESYFRNCYDPEEDIPEYEVCEITTAAVVKGAYKLVTEFSRINS